MSDMQNILLCLAIGLASGAFVGLLVHLSYHSKRGDFKRGDFE